MKNFICVLIFGLIAALCHAEMRPAAGVATIPDYPVLYVNTVDATPIDQKETYIDATAWLDASALDGVQSFGSESSPLELGIRGRGNASWLADGPKPYKMKFEKKQPFFNRVKNKHWVLLPVVSYAEYYNNLVGFEIGRQLGLPFMPARFPVQLVLNGTFVGMYMLGENIRIDEGRVDIYEQPDNNTDPSTVPYGWLVEVDNYSDPCQIRIPNLTRPGAYTRITYHTPEELSPLQEEWLTNQFTGFSQAAHSDDIYDRAWEEYVDIDGLARYFVVQEILHNHDAYVGSWYLYRDKTEGDAKWSLGPLWDLGWSFDGTKTRLLCETDDPYRYPNFMDDIIRFPRFRKKAKETLDNYTRAYPQEWVDAFCDSLYNVIDRGLEVQKSVWPEMESKFVNLTWPSTAYFKQNIRYLNTRFDTDLNTRTVTLTVEKENDGVLDPADVDAATDAVATLEGMQVDSLCVNDGAAVVVAFSSVSRRPVRLLLVNGVDMTAKIADGCLTLDNIDSDTDIKALFGPMTYIPAVDMTLDRDTVAMLPGQTVTLKALTQPATATAAPVWTSDNDGVAAVDPHGVVTALSPGRATVTATHADGFSAACRVDVLEPEVDYGDDTAPRERLYYDPAKTVDLAPYVDRPDRVTEWLCQNPDMLQLDGDGKGRLHSYGETVVRAKDRYGRTAVYYDIFSCPTLRVEHGTGLVYTHHVLYGSRPTVYVGTPEGHAIAGMTHDGTPVDPQDIDPDGYYTCPNPITDNTTFNIALNTKDTSGVSTPVRLYVDANTLTIAGAKTGARVLVTDTRGAVVFNEASTRFVFVAPGVYIVTVEGCPAAFKVLVP